MRDCLNRRGGIDRVIMSVAATFLTVSTTSVLAQGQPRSSAAELAIEAAIPRPEPANVPPPTIDDFKMDTTASVPPVSKMQGVQADRQPAKPSDTAAVPATPKDDPNKSAAKSAETTSDDSTKGGIAPTPAAAGPAMATPTPSVEPSKEVAKEPAPEPAKEPAKAASNVPAADQPVADKLKDAISAKAGRYFDRKAERAAVEKFYTAREYAPLWTHAGQPTDAVKGIVARLKDAASEGLDPAEYPVPDFAAAITPDALAEADLKLTAAILDYARQAQSGRMHWSQVSADIAYPEHPIDPLDVLANVSTAKDSSATLESYNPPHKLYKQLKAKLAELRGHSGGPDFEIPDGPPLRYSPAGRGKKPDTVMEDARVPKLRARLGIAEAADDTRYDATVAEAVRNFQESVELKPTGVLDERTVRALNTPKHDRQIDTILVNMERWRWLPRDLGASSIGDAYVILNIPDFTLKVMQHGQAIWTTRVVTGKPGIHATPLLTETMKYITVNPTWNVPPSIVYNEYLPALQQDPTVLERMGLRLERNYDGSIHISQPPGEANALGRLRFNFPNKFLVYQHDTPDKYLFDKPERAYSHGCMRVQYPDQYASVLLNITMPNEHYTPEKIRSMYGHSEVDLKFPTPIPVNITYQTAFVDEAGKLQIRKDIYGRDATMIALLRGGAHGRDLENVVAHSQPSYGRPNVPIPAGVNFASDNSYYQPGYSSGFSSGPSFFERLFAPPTPPAPIGRRPVPPRRIYTR